MSYITRALPLLLLLSLMASLLSACSDPGAQQQANQNRVALDKALSYAKSIGVPNDSLKPILTQEQTLIATQAPLAIFSAASATNYYNNISTRYKQLEVQTQGTIQVETEQMGQEAQNQLQSLQQTLAAKQHSDLPLTAITQVYNQNMASMEKARYPKDFAVITTQTTDAITTITSMPTTMDKLKTLSQVITFLQAGHQDASTLQQFYNDDQAALKKATTSQDLQQINQTIESQNQQATSKFTTVIPVLAQARVDELNKNIQQVKLYGFDITAYQKRLTADQTQMLQVKTMQDFEAFTKQIDSDIASMSTDLLKGQTATLIQKFHTEVSTWGAAHQYYDSYNSTSYPLDTAYTAPGIGEDLDRELSNAATPSDYQQALTDTQNAMFHLQMLEADYTDKTSFTMVHATDTKLLNYYKLNTSQVIIVSFVEEALRVYQNGQLVHSFLITAGRPELPPVPGLWSPLWRLYKTTFKSTYPKGSPYWYADTKINYAILYHEGGYFLHDSWWRNDYGPGTQFYHTDSSGNSSADYGSHGCINMPTDDAAWVYNNTSYNTKIIMY